MSDKAGSELVISCINLIRILFLSMKMSETNGADDDDDSQCGDIIV